MKRVHWGMARVNVEGPTYQDEVFEPAEVNLIFGNNGSGKSTLARYLAGKGKGIAWDPEDARELPVYFYDSAYADRTIRADHLAGIFSISQANAEIFSKLEEKEKQKDQLQKQLAVLKGKKAEAEKKREEIQARAEQKAWDKIARLRESFPLAMPDVDPKELLSFLSGCRAEETDAEMLEYLYGAAFGPIAELERYQEMPDTCPSVDLLEVPVLNSAQAPYRAFYKAVEHLRWAREGYDQYAQGFQECCPFCQQKLPDNFRAQFEACFEESYLQDMEKLKRDAAAWQTWKDATAPAIRRNRENPFPGKLGKEYKQIAERVLAKIDHMEHALQRKQLHPEETFQQPDLSKDLKRLCEIAKEENRKIDRMLAGLQDLPARRKECMERVTAQMTFQCQDVLKEYAAQSEEQQTALEAAREALASGQKEMEDLEAALEDLERSKVNTTCVMEAMNRSLQVMGFTGFHIREKPESRYLYELVRDRGDGKDPEPGKGLSEGEQHFLAFLYFYHTVMGSLNEDGSMERKIVVIDDPVTSMDSRTVDEVAAMVREMIEVCRKSSRYGHTEDVRDFIGQIFVFTHNNFFFHRIAYN